MSSALLRIPVLELLKLWGDLTEAYHGVNVYGGNEAEIYAYRLTPYSPTVHGPHGEEFRRTNAWKEANAQVVYGAALALRELCEIFQHEYNCTTLIDGLLPSTWFEYGDSKEFVYRVHVTVKQEPWHNSI